ncbi:hypothetical protein CPB86DRAFT_791269 [Serendipita vermifera]|nr:hypothetical protein CPB86DRAFT_791269 [Serendipita vermifera]
MHKILRRLKPRVFAPEVIEDQQAPSSSLPTEIWLIVLELAIRPVMITNLEFEPFQIDLAYKCLTSAGYGDKRAAKQMALKTSQSLRAVCSLWKIIVDEIYNSTIWVYDDPRHWPDLESKHTSPSYKTRPTNTRKYLRLNRTIMLGEGDSSLKMQYSHPIPTLSLSVHGDGDAKAGLSSLPDIVSFPAHLKVLSLHLNGFSVSNGILKEISSSLTMLTTLRLCVHARLITESLEFPKVITFYLSFLSSNMIPKFTASSDIQWEFPMLRNLALADRTSDRSYSTNMHPFFFRLLKNHIDLIESLRIDPMTRNIFDIGSPTCWLKFSRLNTLATNFDLIRTPDKSSYQEISRQRSTSIQHLVQTTPYLTSLDSGKKLRYFLRACPRLETVTLAIKKTSGAHWSIVKAYGGVCKEHNVKFLDENGAAIT